MRQEDRSVSGRLAILDVERFPLRRHWHLIRNSERDTALLRTLAAFLVDNVRRIIDCPPDPDSAVGPDEAAGPGGAPRPSTSALPRI